jgi:transposase
VPEPEARCATCGRAKRPMGVDISRTIKYVPAHFEEHEFQLEKVACGHCKDGVTTAEGPPKVLEKRSADVSVLAHVVVSKYADHLPLTRLARIYARSGVTIPVSTMAEWVGATADLVAPIADAIAARVHTAAVIGTDATGLKVLDPMSAAHIERGTMWCYVGDGKDVVFRYTPTGEGETGPWEVLKDRTGYIQADAASVFDRLFTGQAARAVEVGCWAHARRKFVALQDADCRVAYPIQLIARLYRVEHLGDARHLDPPDRARLRRERSVPVLEKLQRLIANTLPNEPPSSDFAKAMRYVLNHWAAFTRFLDDGRLRLDNNITEQQLRDIAVGRKNYLFAGSHAAAERAAVLYTLMRTCAQHRVAPWSYLNDVMLRIVRGTPPEDLVPDRWQALHGSGPGTE